MTTKKRAIATPPRMLTDPTYRCRVLAALATDEMATRNTQTADQHTARAN